MRSDGYLVWNSAWPTGLSGGMPWGRPARGALIGKLVYYFRLLLKTADCESGARIQPSSAAGVTRRFAEVFATREPAEGQPKLAANGRGGGSAPVCRRGARAS